MTRAAVARAAGMLPPGLHMILHGMTRNPGVTTVGRIVAAANATEKDLWAITRQDFSQYNDEVGHKRV
jgi:hypothetical protein